jgi:hypothetical protein
VAGGLKLDSAGTIKLATLEDAGLKLQGLHALVERMAVEQKNSKPINNLEMQLKRLASPLQGQLKMQFSPIADLVSAMLLIAGRGSAAQQKVRGYRELVAQIRAQLEIAVAQTIQKHEAKAEE